MKLEIKTTKRVNQFVTDNNGWEYEPEQQKQMPVILEIVNRVNLHEELIAALKRSNDWINAQIITSNDISDYDRDVFNTNEILIQKASKTQGDAQKH